MGGLEPIVLVVGRGGVCLDIGAPVVQWVKFWPTAFVKQIKY